MAKGSFGFEDNSEWKVKIHTTLMNTRHRDELQQQQNEETNGTGANNRGKPKRSTMDVTNIMEKYADYDFGIITLDQLHICTHKVYDSNDYYYTMAQIDVWRNNFGCTKLFLYLNFYYLIQNKYLKVNKNRLNVWACEINHLYFQASTPCLSLMI